MLVRLAKKLDEVLRSTEIAKRSHPYLEGLSGIEAVLMLYFRFLGSHSRESPFIFSAFSAVFSPIRTLVKV